MKQSTTDVLRRGLESTLANWPLIAIRIAESLVFVAIIIGSIIAAIIPVAVAAGLSHFDLQNAENAAQVLSSILVEHWMLILYILGVIFIVLGILIAIHSFVDAASANVFVAADRGAARTTAPRREAFRAFTMDRWLQGGRASWWSVFWIYNLAWSVGGLIFLIPLVVTLAGMLVVQDNGPRIVVACGGLAISFLVILPTAIIVAIWTQKAIIVCVARAANATAALSEGWREIRADFGRHFAVAFIVFVVAFGGAMVLSMFTMPMSLASRTGVSPFMNIAFAPAQIVTSIAQSVFSAAVGMWFLASYVALTEER